MSFHFTRPFWLFLALNSFYWACDAQQQLDHAQSAALGNNGLFSHSPFAAYHNPAVGGNRIAGIGIAAFNRFGLREYSGILLCADVTLDKGRLGFATNLEPLSGLSIQHSKLSFMRALHPAFSFAVTADHIRYLPLVGNKQVLYTFGIYSHIALGKKIEIASVIFNPLQPFLTQQPKERSIAHYAMGLVLQESEQLSLYTQYRLRSGEPFQWSFGWALQQNEIQFYGGLTNLKSVSVGAQWKYQTLVVGIALGYHPQLMVSPNLTVWYAK